MYVRMCVRLSQFCIQISDNYEHRTSSMRVRYIVPNNPNNPVTAPVTAHESHDETSDSFIFIFNVAYIDINIHPL